MQCPLLLCILGLDDLELEQSYNSDVAYQNSKLMNCLFSAELQSRIEVLEKNKIKRHLPKNKQTNKLRSTVVLVPA